MSIFTQIDFSKLPAPDVLMELSYEDVLAQLKRDFLVLMPEMAEAMNLESDPAVKLFEIVAAYVVKIRGEINDGSRANMLAHSYGSNLDNLGAFFNVERLVVQAADLEADPPIAEILETDDAYRRRIQMSSEGRGIGHRGYYEFWALGASGDVRSVHVTSPMPGQVEIYVQSHANNGIPTPALLTQVLAAVTSEEVRVLCDGVAVHAAGIVDFDVEAELTLYPGPGGDDVIAKAKAALAQYIADHTVLGHDMRLSGIYAALHQPGVQNVSLVKPTADIVVDDHQIAHLTSETVVRIVGRDV